MIRILSVLLMLIAGPIMAQSVTDMAAPRDITIRNGASAPRVLEGQADLSFWAALVSYAQCTPALLAESVKNPQARQGCDDGDELCFARAGSTVLQACAEGAAIKQKCSTFSNNQVGSIDFQICVGDHLHWVGDWRVQTYFLDQENFVQDTIGLLQADLPNADAISSQTALTLPERKRAIEALALVRDAPVSQCRPHPMGEKTYCQMTAQDIVIHDALRNYSLLYGLIR